MTAPQNKPPVQLAATSVVKQSIQPVSTLPLPQKVHAPETKVALVTQSQTQSQTQSHKQAEQPPAPKRIVEEKISRSLTLTEAPPIPTIDFESWKAIFKEKFPQIQLVEPIAKSTVETLGITIIYDAITPKEMTFLQNIARTTHILLGPTRIVQVNKLGTKKHSLIVSYKSGVDNDLSIDDISVYLQSPGVKAQLWRTLSNLYSQKSS